jgi:hypothetical protein
VTEHALGLSPTNAADAALDADGDGANNRAEYAAGTDPTNAASYLRIDLGATPGLATVRVAAISNRTYTVQFTDDLGAGVWRKLADLVARPTNHWATIPDPAGTTNRFYRLALPAQP